MRFNYASSVIQSFQQAADKSQRLLADIPKYLQWHFQDSRHLLHFRNRHQGQSCFIIGNGPSLNRMNLLPLNDCLTFGLNKIYLIFETVDLRLTYHVAVNPLVIEQSIEALKNLDCASFLAIAPSYRILEKHEHIYRVFTKKPFVNRLFGGNSLFFQEDISKPLHEGFTVTYVAMQIAFYMGFSNVYLIGVDHNFITEGKPNEQQRLVGSDPNHFAPHYFGNQDWNLPDLEASEKAYRLAKIHFERAGRKIYDATVGGKLNVFPKISYEEALSACQKQQKL